MLIRFTDDDTLTVIPAAYTTDASWSDRGRPYLQLATAVEFYEWVDGTEATDDDYAEFARVINEETEPSLRDAADADAEFEARMQG